MQDDIMMQQPYAVPVYLFTGFLEAGKTKFIQETLCDTRFDSGERTLLIVCEEGELEYEPEKFYSDDIAVRTVDDEADFTQELLRRWEDETGCERVMVEWNGMWMLDTLYEAMPQHWAVLQEFMFADARSFLNYNTNMRQLVYDKLKSCELAIFNRFDPAQDIMPFHKIVRGANRSCEIAYEDESGKVRYDEIEDPLPFDIDAPLIEIGDLDYALWYRDLNEDLESYDGKTVCFKGQVALSDELPEGTIIIGRQLMTCCADDIQFAGLIAVENPLTDLSGRDWVTLTAEVRVSAHPGYTKPGPVLHVKEIAHCQPPREEVATFY